MAKEKEKNDDKQPIIIIKRVKKGGDGHHGGAWKVAYADFVTAMMAFFLLLWLLNVTTDEQRAQIAAYFSPADPRIAETLSGSGGVMGGTTVSEDGALTSEQTPVAAPNEPALGEGREEGETGQETGAAEMDRQDRTAFSDTEEKIRAAIESDADMQQLSQHLLVDMTPEGLRIQIIDQEGKPMFALGSAAPLPAAEKLLKLVAQTVAGLPNRVSVRGHTDSRPYGRNTAYGNWELSAERANASRRVLLAGGMDARRVENVQGRADREPLVENDPASARNRRISIILLKQSLVAGLKKKEILRRPAADAPPGPRKREEGVIYFP